MIRRARPLVGVTAVIVALAGLAGFIVTVGAFAFAWPYFTDMRADYLFAKEAEEPVSAEEGPVIGAFLGTFPALLVVLALAGAALHLAVAHAPGTSARELWVRARARLGPVVGVHLLRGVAVAAAAMLSLLACAAAAYAYYAIAGGERPLRGGGPFDRLNSTAMMVAPAVFAVRISFALAPSAAAVDGLAPMAALRHSWSVVWSRRTWAAVGGVLLAAAAGFMVLFYVLLRLANPLEEPVDAAVLAHISPNTYVGYVAAQLTPYAIAILLAAAVVVSPAQAALTALYRRLRPHPGQPAHP
ncbi:hypothetical protein [Streptomyces boninensis]|uniref:hypothetical protein n=1 Tax=Streptomyces boninensis TaxID=2039455 RepID=UPI003B22777D